MKDSKLYITVGVAVVSVVLLSLYLSLKKPNKETNKIIFIGGLDNRKGDLKLPDQVELLKKGLQKDFEISPYRYSNGEGALNQIEKSKDPMYVIMFSAGARHSNKIASKMKQKGFDLNKIYIVEPWGKGNSVKRLQDTAELGVPAKNFLVGSSSSTGNGVISGATSTPNCSPGHWCAVTEVGKIINEL